MDDELKPKNKNQSLILKRDGKTQVRTTWAEKVIESLKPVGTERQGLWFTHASLYKRLQDYCSPEAMPDNLRQVLYDLVKSGHLERAVKPDKLKAAYQIQQEYIYRLTGKPFKVKPLIGMNAPADDLQKAYQVKLDHPALPKWFRDMMMT